MAEINANVWDRAANTWRRLVDTAAITWNTSVKGQVTADIGSGIIRERLTEDRTYYVRADGSDSNTGLIDSAAGAFLTIQKAVDVVFGTLDLAGFDVDIQVRDGTYTAAVVADYKQVGQGDIRVLGNTSTPSNVVISTTSANCVLANNGARLLVEGLKLQTTTSGIGLFAFGEGSTIFYSNIVFGACVTGHITSMLGAYVEFYGSGYTINGNAPHHFSALGEATIRIPTGKTLTLSGTPDFSIAFADIVGNGFLALIGPPTFSGSATGKRFSVRHGSHIFFDGATNDLQLLPGDEDGEFVDSGRYGGHTPTPPNRYISTRTYCGFAYANGGTSSQVADVLYATPIAIYQPHTFDRITFGVLVTGTATLARVGIYEMLPTGLPGALVVDAGTVDVSGTGVKEVTIDQDLLPGVYALAIVMDGTITLTRIASSNPALSEAWGLGSSITTPTTLYSVAHTFAALPDPFGSGSFSAADTPHLRLRAA